MAGFPRFVFQLSHLGPLHCNASQQRRKAITDSNPAALDEAEPPCGYVHDQAATDWRACNYYGDPLKTA